MEKKYGEERIIRQRKNMAGYGKKRTQKQAPVRRLVQSGRRTTNKLGKGVTIEQSKNQSN